MPGDYGPAGKWIHDRAHRIMQEGDTKDEYGKKKGKSVAYAIAVQQAHKLGKSPKDFRTSGGVQEAKMKYDEPKSEYQKTAMLAAFFDEMDEIEKEAFGKALLLAGALGTAGVGGGAHLAKTVATKAPTAITQVAKQAKGGLLTPAYKRIGTIGGGQTAQLAREGVGIVP